MAAVGKNKQNGRHHNRNSSASPNPREYGELLYGHKRKASNGHVGGSSVSKRVTRSRGSKSSKQSATENCKQMSAESMSAESTSKQYEGHSSRIPIRSKKSNNGLSNSSLSPNNDFRGSNQPEHNSPLSGPPPEAPELGDHLNRTDDQFPDGTDVQGILANMNQRLKKLDKLDDISSALTSEINRVQSQVGEVSNQVNTVKTDLNRCEEKWEAGTSALIGRMEKVEQGLQAFEHKWQDSNSSLLNDISSVQSGVDSNLSKITKLEKELASYKEKMNSLETLERKIKDSANGKFSELKDNIKTELSQEWKETHSSTEQELRYDMLKSKAFNKRHNLVIFGLSEGSTPEADLKEMSTFFSKRMGLTKIRLETAYRIGSVGGRPRPLVVRFYDIQDRWAVWNRKSKIKYVKGTPVWIQEDLPKRLREDNRVLQRVAKMARTRPEKYTDIKVKDYKISINGNTYDCDHLNRLPAELSPAMVYTPCSDKACVFFTKHSPFSNHFSSPFSLDGVRFTCIEQYLAVQKAHIADNKNLAREAMGSADPADHKVVLNKLKAEVADVWAERAPAIIKSAVKAKFTQNQNLTKFLLDSHPLLIGEASKDTFWGTGLTLEHPETLDTSKWAAEGNLLGRTLVSLREELLETANFPAN